MSIWHPLWLPKAILDETEKGERLKLKKIWEERQSLDEMDSDDVDGVPLWAQEKEWGNDGLVTVQSAKWGEFLGIMEGCERKPDFIIGFARAYLIIHLRLGNERCERHRYRSPLIEFVELWPLEVW